jgi:hypothetical protein
MVIMRHEAEHLADAYHLIEQVCKCISICFAKEQHKNPPAALTLGEFLLSLVFICVAPIS